MKMTGAEILIESLKKEGVKHMCGYPGGVVLNIFDLLHDEKDLHLILTRHEQGAVHAADGYARATGKAGVVLVTSGPGATTTIIPAYLCSMDAPRRHLALPAGLLPIGSLSLLLSIAFSICVADTLIPLFASDFLGKPAWVWLAFVGIVVALSVHGEVLSTYLD